MAERVDQAEQDQPDAVQFRQRGRHRRGPLLAGRAGLRLPAVVVRERAEPRLGQVEGGRRGQPGHVDGEVRA
jgi:hypothetical protein